MAPCAFVYKMADRTEFKSDDRASPKPIFWLWLWATIHTNLAVLKIILSSSIFYSFIFFLLHAAYGTSRLWHVVWLVSLVHFIYKDNKKWKKKKNWQYCYIVRWEGGRAQEVMIAFAVVRITENQEHSALGAAVVARECLKDMMKTVEYTNPDTSTLQDWP